MLTRNLVSRGLRTKETVKFDLSSSLLEKAVVRGLAWECKGVSRFRVQGVSMNVVGLDSRIETVFLFLELVKESDVRDRLFSLYRALNRKLGRLCNVVELVVVLKAQTDHELSALSTAFGRMYPKDLIANKSLEDVRLNEWLFEVREHSEEFYEKFSKAVDFVYVQSKWNLTVDVSFRQWLKCFASWATSGTVVESDEVKKVRKSLGMTKSKWATAVVDLSLYEKVELELMKPDDVKVMSKYERNGIRNVIVAGLYGYLTQSYVMMFVERVLTGNRFLYNYLREEEKKEFWIKRLEKCGRGSRFVDVDYSSWDSSVSHRMINVITGKLVKLIRDQFPLSERKYVDDAFYKIVNITLEGKKVVNGLVSGSRLTTFINSVGNAGLNLAVSFECNDRLYVDDSTHLGDDGDGETSVGLVIRSGKMKEWNFTVNLTKSTDQLAQGEFLKMEYSADRIGGNKFRLLGSLLWSGLERGVVSKRSASNERVILWNLWASRGGFLSAGMVTSDIVGFTGGNSRIIRDWVTTPVSLGGAGLTYLQKGRTMVRWEEESSMIKINDKFKIWLSRRRKGLIDLSRVYGIDTIMPLGASVGAVTRTFGTSTYTEVSRVLLEKSLVVDLNSVVPRVGVSDSKIICSDAELIRSLRGKVSRDMLESKQIVVEGSVVTSLGLVSRQLVQYYNDLRSSGLSRYVCLGFTNNDLLTGVYPRYVKMFGEVLATWVYENVKWLLSMRIIRTKAGKGVIDEISASFELANIKVIQIRR